MKNIGVPVIYGSDGILKNIDEANYIVTNDFYQKNNPYDLRQNLNLKYKLFKEFKVDKMIINSVYKVY